MPAAVRASERGQSAVLQSSDRLFRRSTKHLQTALGMKIVAERNLVIADGAGAKHPLTVSIGLPEVRPEYGDFICSVTIQGLEVKSIAAYGVDSLQAVRFALKLVDNELADLARTVQVTWVNGDTYANNMV